MKPSSLAVALACLACSFPLAAHERGSRQDGAAQSTPGARADAPAAKAAAGIDAVDPVLRAQILLERAWFSPGEIDGAWGGKSRLALAGFQASRGLEASGQLDDATWAELDKDAAPALVDYTIAAEDVAGPFLPTPGDTAAKAKLDSLPYQSAAEALGEKFHSSPALLAALNPGVPLDVAGGVLRVPNVREVAPLAAAAAIEIDKSDASLRLLDAAGVAYAQFPVTSGSPRFPLPIGEWTIQSIDADPTYRYDPALIDNAPPGDRKALLPPGPNSPVGTTWMALSKPHYGIHGSPDPARIGRDASSGCVRLTNWSAQAVAGAARVGMAVRMVE